MKIAFVGVKGLGGVVMRGQQPAYELGVPCLGLHELKEHGKFDVLILVKYHREYGSLIRKRCNRLIYDPLDCWSSLKHWRHADPVEFWKWTRRELGYDEIIATSPACATVMQEALPMVKVHMLPHHADRMVGPHWHDPDGPIVYAGGQRFLGDQMLAIEAGCRANLRELIVDIGRACEKSLKGSALCLHPRLAPEDSPLNRWCKPQIKLENCAAAGLPILATKHPCIYSLRPDLCWIDDGQPWEKNIRRALDSPPLAEPVTLGQHVESLRKVIGNADRTAERLDC